jgi:mannose-6-phosphate isomerase
MATKKHSMSKINLYPLQFGPIYQYRIWGGRHLADLLFAPLPGDGPIGEAWMLSDRDDHASLVANGSLKGQTITQVMEQYPEQLMGKFAGHFNRFPLLLKFLDASELLSVQVHPSDEQKDYIPAGEHGKSEAWVVLKAEEKSLIYAGLKSKTTTDNLRHSIMSGTIEDYLSCFTPKSGDVVFIPAGTVHALGGDVVVFEVQQNSDVTFRLYDWNHVDAKTGHPRALQVNKAFACIDFSQGVIKPAVPVVEMIGSVKREHLIHCDHFCLSRISGESPFVVGAADAPHVLVCIAGDGQLEYDGAYYAIRKGDVFLLPAMIGVCTFWPKSKVSLLEISI